MLTLEQKLKKLNAMFIGEKVQLVEELGGKNKRTEIGECLGFSRSAKYDNAIEVTIKAVVPEGYRAHFRNIEFGTKYAAGISAKFFGQAISIKVVESVSA